MARETPLYGWHQREGAKMTTFSGWSMPLWYESGHIAEHMACRKSAVIFDTSHMKELLVVGKDALDFLSLVFTANMATVKLGNSRYTLMLNEKGGVVDDCIVSHMAEGLWMLVMNASITDNAIDWLRSHIGNRRVRVLDISEQTVKIDLQGPSSVQILSAASSSATRIKPFRYFSFQQDLEICGLKCTVSRTGYTGEFGFELYCSSDDGLNLWEGLLDAGTSLGLIPAGLGARDSLRTEAGYPLHGHEISSDRIFPQGLWEFTLRPGGGYLGHTALELAVDNGDRPFVHGFRLTGPRKAMPGFKVYLQDEEVGEVVSGIMSPILDNQPIGFLLSEGQLRLDSPLEFEDPRRSGRLSGFVTQPPFVELSARRSFSDFVAPSETKA